MSPLIKGWEHLIYSLPLIDNLESLCTYLKNINTTQPLVSVIPTSTYLPDSLIHLIGSVLKQGIFSKSASFMVWNIKSVFYRYRYLQFLSWYFGRCVRHMFTLKLIKVSGTSSYDRMPLSSLINNCQRTQKYTWTLSYGLKFSGPQNRPNLNHNQNGLTKFSVCLQHRV